MSLADSDTIGLLGCGLVFIKIAIQVYLGSLNGIDFLYGKESGFRKLELAFAPIYYDVDKKHEVLRRFGNMCYFLGIIVIVYFLITVNSNKAS